MSRKFANVLSLALIAAALVASALAYPNLPDQVPTHWNAAGDIDGYSGRLFAVLLGPAMAIGMVLLMWAIPVISPHGFRTEGFQHVINVFQVAMVVFSVGLGGLIIAAGFGYDPSIERVVPVAVGALFIVIGNYLGKVRKNFFIGIRTPWTLASDEVWARTHRLGGYLFVLAGIVMAASPLVPRGTFVVAVAVGIAALVPVGYSFFAYRRIEGLGPDDAPHQEVSHD